MMRPTVGSSFAVVVSFDPSRMRASRTAGGADHIRQPCLSVSLRAHRRLLLSYARTYCQPIPIHMEPGWNVAVGRLLVSCSFPPLRPSSSHHLPPASAASSASYPTNHETAILGRAPHVGAEIERARESSGQDDSDDKVAWID
jgi:hypothetical protein